MDQTTYVELPVREKWIGMSNRFTLEITYGGQFNNDDGFASTPAMYLYAVSSTMFSHYTGRES